MKKNKHIPIDILVIGTIINSIVISLLIKLYQSSKLCDLDPECMDESGMLYMVYYVLLIVGTVILIFGVIKTIKAFLRKEK